MWRVSGHGGHAAEGQLEHELMLIVWSNKHDPEVRMRSPRRGPDMLLISLSEPRTEAAAFQSPQRELWMGVGHKVSEKQRMTEFLEFTDFAGIWLDTPFNKHTSDSIGWHDLIGREHLRIFLPPHIGTTTSAKRRHDAFRCSPSCSSSFWWWDTRPNWRC